MFEGKENVMKLLKVIVSLYAGKYRIAIHSVKDLNETKMCFLKEGKRIEKKHILVARETYLTNQPHFMMFSTYCLPEDKEKAIKVLSNKINEEFTKTAAMYKELTETFNNGYTVEEGSI